MEHKDVKYDLAVVRAENEQNSPELSSEVDFENKTAEVFRCRLELAQLDIWSSQNIEKRVDVCQLIEEEEERETRHVECSDKRQSLLRTQKTVEKI